jgi:fatty-acyl-CoA synthase
VPETIVPTPTDDSLPRRFADFETVGEALDYAAQGVRGLNFHDPRGALIRAYPFRELREDALAAARRLIAEGVKPRDRVAMVAETGPDFAALFFGAVYAGAWPVPLPLPTSFGGRDSYIEQLSVQLSSADPTHLFYPAELESMAGAAAEAAGVKGLDWEAFATRDAPPADLPKADPDEIAYLQYSSGSTRFPHGVAVTHRGLLNNLAAHSIGMEVRRRPLRLVAALVSRHGPGRLPLCRRSRTRSRPITSRPRISRAGRSPGST